MADLTPDEEVMLQWHAAFAAISHLTPSGLAQVNYELQKKGLIEQQGCCGGPELTQKGLDHLWNSYRNSADKP